MTKKVHEYAAYSKQSQVIKYQRQRGFHIPELGKFLKAPYRRLQRHPRILVYTVLNQVMQQQQPLMASQIGEYLSKVVGFQRKQETVILRTV